MGRFRAYIKPFDESGAYADSYVEVTDDFNFDKMGNIDQQLDSNDYDVGVFKFTGFNFTLENSSGRYSDVTAFQSIFKHKIMNSKFKLTWQQQTWGNIVGSMNCGFFKINLEMDIFEGLISDEASQKDITGQDAAFVALGYESIFDRVAAPFGSMMVGDTYSSLIFKCLNQLDISNVMTVDALNISVGHDDTVDAIADFQNNTVTEALSTLLLISNSVLFIKNGICYVAPRTESADLKYTFYGQGSNNGIENIQKIDELTTGYNKLFNYWTWNKTEAIEQDVPSVDENGIRAKDIGFTQVTNLTKKQNVLSSLLAEFKNLKQEFVLYTPITIFTVPLFLLDKVNVDYPNVFYPADDNPVPLYDVAKYDQCVFPFAQWAITIPTSDNYKIMGRTVDTKNQLFKYYLRKV